MSVVQYISHLWSKNHFLWNVQHCLPCFFFTAHKSSQWLVWFTSITVTTFIFTTTGQSSVSSLIQIYINVWPKKNMHTIPWYKVSKSLSQQTHLSKSSSKLDSKLLDADEDRFPSVSVSDDLETLLGLYALHLVFLPKIQEQLDQFRLGRCHHKLRTEQNKTPYQLWIIGMSINFADQLLSNVSNICVYHW